VEDHDQRFKVLLREFFAEFLHLFFPAWAGRFDLTRITWLEQEVFPDPPRGDRRAVDLIARLPVLQPIPLAHGPPAESWITLVHVEIEYRDSVAPVRPRLFEYYEFLRWKHRLPVLPIGLFLRVGLEGVGWDSYEEYFWERRLVHFDYPYVGLPALDAEQYLRQDNWLEVALTALMRVSTERRLELGQEAWRRLVQCPESPYRRYLLCECVDTYLPTDEEQRREFDARLLSEPDPGVRSMTMTLFERLRKEGVEKGREEGLKEAQRETLLLQLEARFGPLAAEIRQQVESLPADRLKELLVAIVKAQSLADMGL
jgi:hypothetical protein